MPMRWGKITSPRKEGEVDDVGEANSDKIANEIICLSNIVKGMAIESGPSRAVGAEERDGNFSGSVPKGCGSSPFRS